MSHAGDKALFRIPPYFYIHVLDQTLNITRLEIGPQTFIRQDNEKVVHGPEKMITIPPHFFCVIDNPALRSSDGEVVCDRSGQVKLAHGDQEIRLTQDPFPLYPGEILSTGVRKLIVVHPNTALRLTAILDFDEEGTKRTAGDEWLFEELGHASTYQDDIEFQKWTRSILALPFLPSHEVEDFGLEIIGEAPVNEYPKLDDLVGYVSTYWIDNATATFPVPGPGTYIPRKEVNVVETINAIVRLPNQAIRLRARKNLIDRSGIERVTGEEWLAKGSGAYLPGAYEEVVSVVSAHVLTDKTAIHLRAIRSFTDDFGKVRKAGEEWLITLMDTETHIPSVYEEVVGTIAITTLTNRQYCVILDPVDEDGKPQLGRKKLVKGEHSFFQQPYEKLERGIQSVYVLSENEGLILKATEEYEDVEIKEVHRPGDRWMIRGPAEYVPPVEVEVVCKRQAIPLDENEGIYVRNIKTGKVRAITGETYMLNQDEELWEKSLSPVAEELLNSPVEGSEEW